MKRGIQTIISGTYVMEGAGVRLMRLFSNREVKLFDPFLLLDHFGSSDPKDYMKGFPWHPHRGIETVTYMLTGEVEHGDSIGNKGTIRSGDIQWMTAGKGIIHQEMPKAYEGLMQGFQLWVNLPRKEKMTEPKYRDILSSSIPVVVTDGHTIKVVAGRFGKVKGPIDDLKLPIEYYHIMMKRGELAIRTDMGHNAFIYVYEGTLAIGEKRVEKGNCALLSAGDTLEMVCEKGAGLIYVSGPKLEEPVAWGGPIVMNTREELEQAFQEIEDGSFIV